jgi:hypothetical protein
MNYPEIPNSSVIRENLKTQLSENIGILNIAANKRVTINTGFDRIKLVTI